MGAARQEALSKVLLECCYNNLSVLGGQSSHRLQLKTGSWQFASSLIDANTNQRRSTIQ